MKRQKDMYDTERWTTTLHPPTPTSFTTGEEWRNSFRSNEEAGPKQKWHPVVDMSGGEAKSDAVKDNIA